MLGSVLLFFFTYISCGQSESLGGFWSISIKWSQGLMGKIVFWVTLFSLSIITLLKFRCGHCLEVACLGCRDNSEPWAKFVFSYFLGGCFNGLVVCLVVLTAAGFGRVVWTDITGFELSKLLVWLLQLFGIVLNWGGVVVGSMRHIGRLDPGK